MLALVAVGWSAWSVWQVASDLRAARDTGELLVDAAEADEREELVRQAGLLAEQARRAADGSDGWWWDAMGWTPVLGDDIAAVADVSASLDSAAGGALVPLATRLSTVESVAKDGRLDTDLMVDLRPEVSTGAEALEVAADRVADLRPEDYAGPIGDAVGDWVDAVTSAATAARDAASTLEVLPDMVGATEPQRILLVFESNAEIRATSGLPGSWTLVEADRGRLSVLRQGSGGDIEAGAPAPVPTSQGEQAVWGPQLGLFFRDATMTSDYPRAAELMRQRWSAFGGEPLDAVVSVDVVTTGYLLEGLGPIRVGDVSLDADNAADALLNGVYENVPVSQQDAVFATVARAMIAKLTDERIPSALDLLLGIARGTAEDRVHAAWFDPEIAAALAGTTLEGAFETEPGTAPVVDVTLNDATGSKMSYFLRYDVDVDAVDCGGGRQRLEGRMRLWQTVPAAEAAGFSTYVTGNGRYGVPAGRQVVLTRIFGPVGGSVVDVEVGGEPVDPILAGAREFERRPVVTLALQPDSRDGTLVTWAMVTGDGQVDGPRLRVTPGVEEGTQSRSLPSACGS